MSSLRPRAATLSAVFGMVAITVPGLVLVPRATAAPPTPAPAALAARSAAAFVASRPVELHASPHDAFLAHPVISVPEGLQYVPYDRTYQGLPVYGGDFVVTTDAAGRVLSVAVGQSSTIAVSTTPARSAASAAAVARSRAVGKVVDGVSAGRRVVFALGTPRLAWEHVVTSHTGARPSKLHVFTDAGTGAVAYSYDEVREGSGTGKWNGPNPLPIDTSHPTSTTWTMSDPVRSGVSCRDYSTRAVLSGSDDVWGNGVGTSLETGCVDALYGVQTQWKMLSAWLGRNGTDGSGGGLPVDVGLNQNNAFYYWHDRVEIGHNPSGEWVSSLDIVGHEFGHGLDDYTPGGIGASEVAEFTADVLGTMTESYANESAAYDPPDYAIGEEVNLVGTGPIRYMYNPSLVGDPNCYSSSVPTMETHAAAGPGNHWFYLLAEGTNPTNGQPTSTTCNGSTGLVGIGIQAAGKIFYNAMLAKTTGMTYLQYRTATLNAAKNLTPGNCTNFNKVKAAWDAVSVPAQSADPTCTTGSSDDDQDGVLNGNDVCPQARGWAEFRGCPEEVANQPARTARPDFNGDGKADFCRLVGTQNLVSSTVQCTVSTGTGFGATYQSGVLDWGQDLGRAWADFNGDGKADFCRVVGTQNQVSSTVQCTVSTGTGFGATYQSGVLDWGQDTGRGWADFDGDGKADYCRPVGTQNQVSSTVQCTRSTGTGFGATYQSYVLDWGQELGRAWVDYNGDGKADYCRAIGSQNLVSSRLQCTLSNGTGSPSFPTTHQSAVLDWGHSFGRAWVDFDGDGRADYCRRVGGENLVSSYLACTVYSSVGFGATYQSGVVDWGYDFGRAWADYNGDGKADYCRLVGDQNLSSSYLQCTLSNGTGSPSFATTHQSSVVDWGYDFGKAWIDFDGDGRADYCRLVGERNLFSSYVSCTTYSSVGFGATYQSGVVDWGREVGRSWP